MHRTLRAALDLIYPQDVACTLCGAELTGGGIPLCPACEALLSHEYEHICPGCGRPSAEPDRCHNCRQHGDVADDAVAALAYEGRTRSVVAAFKLQDKTGYANLLASLMVQALRQKGAKPPDCVVPVPMHWRRRFHRGYNQSELLAAEVAHMLGRPMLRGALARPVYTKPTIRQRGNAAVRRASARRSYGQGKGTLTGKTVLLVDDILTTGSTLRACVALLRAQGAVAVITLVAAAVPEGGKKREFDATLLF